MLSRPGQQASDARRVLADSRDSGLERDQLWLWNVLSPRSGAAIPVPQHSATAQPQQDGSPAREPPLLLLQQRPHPATGAGRALVAPLTSACLLLPNVLSLVAVAVALQGCCCCWTSAARLERSCCRSRTHQQSAASRAAGAPFAAQRSLCPPWSRTACAPC